jgi:hypothetical protein
MGARRASGRREWTGALSSSLKKLLLTSPRPFRRNFGPSFFKSLKPEFLWLEATDACGAGCAFCEIWRREPTRDVLTAAEVETALPWGDCSLVWDVEPRGRQRPSSDAYGDLAQSSRGGGAKARDGVPRVPEYLRGAVEL